MHDLTEPFLRLLAATVVGTVIGINRDLYGKPTGVRLHALVSIASALLVMLAGELGSGTPDHAAASRIIQGIVGGIGLLAVSDFSAQGDPASRQRQPGLSHHHCRATRFPRVTEVTVAVSCRSNIVRRSP